MDRPKVGVGVIILKDDKVLLGKRIGKSGHGTWSFPGGHLEYGEEIFECAERETFEEAGIQITNLHYAPFTNDINTSEEKHYVTFFVTADYLSGSVKVMEKDIFETWEWFDWSDLPSPLFLPLQNLIKKNYNPFKEQ